MGIKKGEPRYWGRYLTDEQKEIIRQMLLDGKSSNMISKTTGFCTSETVNKYRKKWGIPIYKRSNEDLRSTNYLGHTNICIDCKKACGDCSWSMWDEENGRTAFIPVEGWTTKEYELDGLVCEQIVACPLFERDR